MRLQLLTWSEVENHILDNPAIIIPIGSTEQHGPNGLIGTDALLAEAIANEVGERTGALVAPVIAVGMAQHHMAFAGSMSLKPSTLVTVIKENVLSLARHGFFRFYFINGHGGNISTITTAFQEIYAEASLSGGQAGIDCVLRNWWNTQVIRDIAEELFGDGEGRHATASEVAMTQHLFPDHIKHVKMEPAKVTPHVIADAEDFRRRYPDGRIASNPALATPEAGARFFEAAVGSLVEDFPLFARGDNPGD
jgi:creatinine amidohydrolase